MMARTLWILVLAIVCTAVHPVSAATDSAPVSSRVIILANANEPESQRLAAYYADKRQVPPENVIALPMPSVETLGWRAFIDTIFQPLQDELVRRKWIDAIGSDAKDKIGRSKYVISGHKIAYLVVCRGVPLRIEHDASLYAPLRPWTNQPQFQTNSGAVDSELSLLANANYPINALVSNPLFSNDHPNMFQLARVVKVSRLDGPSYAEATALIDSALSAEQNGLIGRAYVDIGGIYKQGDDWLEETAKEIDAANFDLSVDRESSTLAPTARFDAPVLYFGWYANDLNGPFAQPEFHFPPGAIALHIHSFSARTLSSPHQGWTGPFVARGVTATVGNVYEPYLPFTHYPQLLAKAILRGDRWGDAVYYALPALSWQTMAIGDPLYQPLARTFAQQWVNRDQLPDELYAYVVLRELRRLQHDLQVDACLLLAEQTMRARPSVPVALKWAEVAENANKPDVARRAAEWLAARPSWKPAEIPLADEAAQILVRLERAETAVDLYSRLLSPTTLSKEFRVSLLLHGAKAATAAHRDSLATQWNAEAARLTAG